MIVDAFFVTFISSNTIWLTLWLTRKVNQEVNQYFMKASVSVICYKHKVLANGESPLMLRIAKDSKRTMKSLGISVNPAYWDFGRNQPKNTVDDFYKQLITELKEKGQIGNSCACLSSYDNLKSYKSKTFSNGEHPLMQRIGRERKTDAETIFIASASVLNLYPTYS